MCSRQKKTTHTEKRPDIITCKDYTSKLRDVDEDAKTVKLTTVSLLSNHVSTNHGFSLEDNMTVTSLIQMSTENGHT